MKIAYFSKNVYGLPKNYILNGDQRQAWTALTGDKTVEPSKAKALSDLFGGNVEWEQVPDPANKPLG